MDVNTAMNQLIQALSETNEFKELQQIKRRLKQDQQISRLLEQYSKKQEILYQPNLTQNQYQAVLDEVKSDYAKLSTVPEIKKYFAAEENFSNLINNLMNNINTSLERLTQ